MTHRNLSIVHACLFGALSFATFTTAANASVRILFQGEGNQVVTGRTMDWCQDVASNVWVFPRGIDRDGGCGPNSLKWTSQFGSVVLSANDNMTVDGMNERGLVVNGIRLPETNFGKPDRSRPLVCSSIWAQWMLDSFGSVRDAVATLQSENFCLVAPRSNDDVPFFAHVALSDQSGDSALLGWSEGRLSIHFGKDFNVLAGAATLQSQIMMTDFRKQFGDEAFIEDGDQSALAFATACATLDRLPKSRQPTFAGSGFRSDFAHQANASVLGALRTISTPFGVCHPVRPDFKPTRWRTMYDQKNMVMHFDCATTMSSFWIPMSELNLVGGAPVRKLSLTGGKAGETNTGSTSCPGRSGNVVGIFENATPFTFLSAAPN